MSIEILSKIVNDVGHLIQKTDSNYQIKIKEFINIKYMDWTTRFPWPELLIDRTKNATAGNEEFILPKDMDELVVIAQRTSPRVLISMSESERQRRYLDTITTQEPEFGFSPVGEVGAEAQPSSASLIDIVSSSTSDGSTIKVRIWGKASNGEIQSEAVALNGTTAASTVYLYSRIDRVSKSADTVGVITVSKSGTTFATMAPNEDTARYKRIKLIHVPSNAETFYMTGFRRVFPLINDEDVPEIPVANALKLGAYALCLKEQRQHAKAQIQMGEAEALVGQLFDKGAVRGDRLEQAIPHIEDRR